MKRIIEAFEGVFTTAVQSGGDLARTAGFALENVDWTGGLNKHEPTSNRVVEAHLATTCANSGQKGSITRAASEALLAEIDTLLWHTYSRSDDPDLATFSRNYAATVVIGNGGLLPSDKVTAGFSLQGRNIHYPPHAHIAEESYWILGGGGDWKVDAEPWFAVKPGDSIFHKSGAVHAMQTNDLPMLTVWLWTSHLDSEVVMLGGD
ncbi:MAG: dimethylsulfonioproprionate lyase family protein [Alphaproteobacteria bacterium]